VWEYDDILMTQTLVKMTALCPRCHQSKHPGLANVNGKIEQVIDHLMKVNEMTRLESMTYLDRSFIVWMNRSRFEWSLDISKLDLYI
jgi:hypothetical protein